MTRVVLFGTGASANQFLRFTEEASDIEIALVATSSDDALADHALGRSRKILLFDQLDKADLFEAVKQARPDLLFSITSPFIFGPDWLSLPRLGAYNLHPSPLPRLGGFYPFIWAIIKGETEHGVTIHRLTSQIDGGGIVAQKLFPIAATETGASLYLKCANAARALYPGFFNEVANGPLEGRPQDMSQRSIFRRQIPLGGRASFTWDAATVERAVRAFTFKPFNSPIGELTVALADGSRVSLDSARLEQEGGNGWLPGTLLGFDQGDALVGCGQGIIRIRRMAGGPARDALEGRGAILNENPFVD